MLESFYGLTTNPFRMSADEHFRYSHRAYVKAHSYLKYALEQGEGFVLITGRPGTGKTLLIREMLSELDSDRVQPVNLATNQLQGEELLRLVALDFGFQAQDFNKATLLTRIEQHALTLHEQGRRVVVIVDEAQNLSTHGLEELRLLSNLQSGNQSLFQIVLIGQEELRNLIYGQGIENIQQRIVASCRLEPMQDQHVRGYVEHRLGIVGWESDPTFEAGIFPLLHRMTQGVPREINLVMARLLLYGSLEKKHALHVSDLLVVLNELDQEQRLAFDKKAVLAELQQSADASGAGEAQTADEAEGTADGEKSPDADLTMAEDESEKGVDAWSEQVDPEAKPDLNAEDSSRNESPSESAVEFVHQVETETGQIASDVDQTPDPILSDVEQKESEDSLPLEHEQSETAESEFSFRQTIWSEAEEQTTLVTESTMSEPSETAADSEFNFQQTIWGEAEEQTTPVTESTMNELPSLRAIRDEEGGRPQGLLTDVDDLLESGNGFDKNLHPTWRWLFYPLAIALLLMALLTPKPSDLTVLWHHLKNEAVALFHSSAEESPQLRNQDHAMMEQPMAAGPSDGAADNGPEGQSAELPGLAQEREAGVTRQNVVNSEAEEAGSEGSADATSIDPAREYWLDMDQVSGEPAAESFDLYGKLTQWLRENPASMVVLTGIAKNGSEPLAQMRDALQQAELTSRLFQQEGIGVKRIVIEGRVAGTGSVHTGVHVKLKSADLSAGSD